MRSTKKPSLSPEETIELFHVSVKKLTDMHGEDAKRSFRSDRSENTIDVGEITTGPLMGVNDEIRFRSFLLGFRLFTMKKEPVFLDEVAKSAKALHADQSFHELIDLLLDRIKRWRTEPGIIVHIPGVKPLSTKESFDLFLYGRLFHLDNNKRNVLEKMDDFILPFFEFEFRHIVCSMFNNIEWLDYVIQNRTNTILIGETLLSFKAALSH
jgi:hypothetical protein